MVRRPLKNCGQTVSNSHPVRVRISELENVAPVIIDTWPKVQVDRKLVSFPECQVLADLVVFKENTACLSKDLNLR